jgi:hypothetical protein
MHSVTVHPGQPYAAPEKSPGTARVCPATCRVGVCAAILVAMHVAGLMQAASVANAADFHLAVTKSRQTGKPLFELNGRPFFPLVYSEHYSRVTSELLTTLRGKGFNTIQVAIDGEDTQLDEFRSVIAQCANAQLPVILEINEWKFWQFLASEPGLDMVMSDGVPVKHFPDYTSPDTRREHLARYARAADDIRPFVGRPIVAVSVGAYDAYHLPDGEVHDDFVVPAHTEKYQTRLPYGKHAVAAFRGHLAASCTDPAKFETDYDPSTLPSTPANARSNEHWRDWILFRRNLVTSWLGDTADTVRKRTGLPIGVSFDLNFARHEKYATPPFAWSHVLDFVSVYCYGRLPDAGYVSGLMRTVWHEYSDTGVPMIGFLEFSSGLAGKTPGDAYARECAPFVSGLMTASPRPERNHGQDRVDSFVRWAAGNSVQELLQMSPERAAVLVVLNRDGIYHDYEALDAYATPSRSCDVLFVNRDWKAGGCQGYRVVVVDDDLALPKTTSGGSNPSFIRANELPTVFPSFRRDGN